MTSITSIYNTSALFAYIFSVLLLSSTHAWEARKLFAVGLATVGVFVVAWGGSSSTSGGEETYEWALIGDAMALLAAGSYGFYEVGRSLSLAFFFSFHPPVRPFREPNLIFFLCDAPGHLQTLPVPPRPPHLHPPLRPAPLPPHLPHRLLYPHLPRAPFTHPPLHRPRTVRASAVWRNLARRRRRRSARTSLQRELHVPPGSLGTGDGECGEPVDDLGGGVGGWVVG